jgi:myo-inositol-1(or 4)-monophosphatase
MFPSLYELYYAEKGGGAWREKSSSDAQTKAERLRVSNCIALENAYFGIDQIDEFSKNCKNIRLTGSDCYNLSLFTAGKLDVLYSSSLNPVLKAGFELFVKEAGGFNIEHSHFIAANQKLGEKVKQQLIKSSL